MTLLIDITGQKFNMLTVLKHAGRDSTNKTQWLCQCDCGNVKVITGLNLKNSNSKSCGCKKHLRGKDNPRTIIDINRIKEKKRSLAADRAWRTKILKRDKVCQKCGSDRELQVHHLESYAVNHSLRICQDNGAVLCFSCHLAFHIKYGRKTGFTKENYYEFAGKTN
jgi:5-methylcytosine-specific restriction endonuclease McrA